MELIKVESNEIIVAQETLNKIKTLNEYTIQLNTLMDKVKEELMSAMKEHDIKSIDNEVFKAVYKAPTTRKSVDTQALKEQGLYDSFLKESPVKESLTVTFK